MNLLLCLLPLVGADSRPASSPSISLACQGSAVYSAEGAYVVERDLDGTKLRSIPIPGMERVRAVALAPGGKTLAVAGGVAGRSGWVVLVDPAGGKVLTSPPSPFFKDVAECVAFAGEGTILVAGSADKTAVALDVQSLTPRTSFLGHTGSVLAVASREKRLLTGSADRTVRVWNLTTGELERTLTQHSGAVQCLAFDPAGPRFVSGSDDKSLRLWDSGTGRLIRIVKGFAGAIHAAVWCSKGVFAAGTDGQLRFIDLDEGGLTPVGSRRPEWLYALALSPSGDALLVGASSGVARVRL